MAGASSKLQILIEAKDNASGPINAAKGSLSGLNDAADTASKGLGGLAAAAGIAGFAALAEQVVSVTFAMGEMGAQALQVEASFGNMATSVGESSGEMLIAMRQASQGMISDQDLMLNANRAMVTGVASNLDELGALLEVAAARAKVMGTDTATAFQDLVRGIGTMQADVIDNLGIITGGAKVFDNYASAIGKTADELTDTEKRQALLNIAIGQTLPMLDDTGIKGDSAAQSFQRFDVAAGNLQTHLGELIAVKIAPWLDGITEAMAGLAYVMNLLSKGQQMNLFPHAPVKDVLGGTKDVAYGQKVLADETEKANKALHEQGANMDSLKKAYDSAQRSIAQIASSQVGTLGVGVLDIQKQITGELGAQVRIWQEMRIDPEQIATVLIPGWLDEQRKVTKETYATGTATEKVNAEYTDLLSTVKSVLSGALDPGVGVDPSSLLPRQDAINEDARRLADVAVNGFASPWAEYFRTAFPDQFREMAASNDIKQGAALMLRNFQDGLEPELINKDLAKERVRKMLIGDANMGALTQEIAQELAGEMGIPLSEALSAARGTLGGSSGAGTEAATSFADAALAQVEGANTGGSIVTTTITQMRAQYPLLATAGGEAAKQWGDAFIAKVGENVPPQLINILTTLITPQVIAQLGQRGTLTGAVP
jgi:hypothetical protein